MPGIFPEVGNGAVVYRDSSGNCLSTPAENTYCPGPDFEANCELTALLSTCTARLTPAQVNAIVSELIALAEALDPSFQWDCNSVNNLATAFGGFDAGLFFGQQDFTGDGSFNSPYGVNWTRICQIADEQPPIAPANARLLACGPNGGLRYLLPEALDSQEHGFYGSVQTPTTPSTPLDEVGLHHNPDNFQSVSYTNSTNVPQVLKCEVVFREQYQIYGNGSCNTQYQFKFNGGAWDVNIRTETRIGLDPAVYEVSSDRETFFPALAVAPGATVTVEARVVCNVTAAFGPGSQLISHVQINALAVPAVFQPLDPGPPNDWTP